MTAAGDPADLTGWTPIRVYRDAAGMMVEWRHTGPVHFAEPFFRETVDRVLAAGPTPVARRQTSIDVLELLAGSEPGLAPAGFIFHPSRAGSTLLTQMLAASDANRVLSEPGPIDDVLRAGLLGPAVPETALVGWLRGLISALGRGRAAEQRLFIKLDPWQVLALPLIRRAFPDVPWVFVFRDPLEILVSQMRSVGSQFVAGPLPPELFELDLATAATAPRAAYAAHVLGPLMAAAERHLDAAGRLIEYPELPAGFDVVLAHFGVGAAAAERAGMFAAADFDAKTPRRRFQPDSAAKRRAADDATRAAADSLRPVYERLVGLRARQPAVATAPAG